MSALKTLLIDNHDSYTYNLYQLIAEVNGAPPEVISNDALDWGELRPALASGRYHNVVISPGPGTPARAEDIGVCLDLLRAALPVPVLGVCLGMQAMAAAHGGRVEHAPEPVHGRLSAVEHAGHELFCGIPSGTEYQVVRYHSLLVDEASLPSCLLPLAWTLGGHAALHLPTDVAPPAAAAAQPGAAAAAASRRLLMALGHASLPQWGVQFHPESVATVFGGALLSNFASMTRARLGLPPGPPPPPPRVLVGPPGRAVPPRPWVDPGGTLAVVVRQVPSALAAPGSAQFLFERLFLPAGGGAGVDTFWLDSATAPDRGRFSYMGGRGGPLWRHVTFHLPPLGDPDPAALGTLRCEDARGQVTTLRTSFLPWLDGTLHAMRCAVEEGAAEALPFDFWGGLVGYLGYELKAECCGGSRVHASRLPDAAFFPLRPPAGPGPRHRHSVRCGAVREA